MRPVDKNGKSFDLNRDVVETANITSMNTENLSKMQRRIGSYLNNPLPVGHKHKVTVSSSSRMNSKIAHQAQNILTKAGQLHIKQTTRKK